MTSFCLACGLPLDPEYRKHNRRFRGKESSHRKFCNDKCAKTHELSKRKRNRAKYGVAGEVYL
jgi:hypothetical protein